MRSIWEIVTTEQERSRVVNKLPIWIGHGEQIRLAEELPIKLAVFDEKKIMLPLKDPIQGKKSMTVLAAEHQVWPRACVYHFNAIW